MDPVDSPLQTLGETAESRESNSGTNAAAKYVNGDVDNMPQQQCILTTITPLDVAMQSTSETTAAPPVVAKQKRDSHNEIERRRKCKINIGIIKLGEIIPSCINAKLSKNQILEHAACHILDLTAKCEKLLTSSASETQAEEIKNLMKENEKLRNDNKRYQDLMKTLQIPPNGVANPAAFYKSKVKSLAQKPDGKNAVLVKNNTIKPAVTNQSTVQVIPTNQNMTILSSANQMTGVNQVGTNQIVTQGAAGAGGNAILVQNPNGGYFLVPANNLNKNVTIPIPSNQVAQSVAPATIVSSQSTTSSAIGQVISTGDIAGQVALGQTATTSTTTSTVTTQCVSAPIATSSAQAPGMVQTIRYIVPMMPQGQGGQTQNQTVMVMAKPNQTMPVRIAPQQPIRMAGTQQQMILPHPSGGVPVSTQSQDSKPSSGKKKSSPPKIKNLCSTDSDSEKSEPIAPAPVGVQSIAPNTAVSVGANQVVLQRPPVQTTGGGGTAVNPNMVTMQVVPKPVSQQLVYLQGPNGQLIPVMINNPNAGTQQQGTVIQQQGQQQMVTIPVNQGGVANTGRQQIVVVSQGGVITQPSQGGATISTAGLTSGVITSVSNSNATMSPLTVVTSQSSTSTSGNHRFSNTHDILAKATESIFSPNSLNDNSPTLSEPNVSSGVAAAPPAVASNKLSSVLPPFPISIQRANDPVDKILQQIDEKGSSSPSMEQMPEVNASISKKQKKAKKKKKKKEKSKDKDKEKHKDKTKSKDKEKSKKKKHKGDHKAKITIKAEKPDVDDSLIKELDRGMANSIDALPDSTSGTAIITDTLLQEWIEKEAGLGNPDQEGEENNQETITNVTAADQNKEAVDTDQGQSSTAPSDYSAEALLAGGSTDSPHTSVAVSSPVEVPPTTSSSSSAVTPAATSASETNTTASNSQNPFGSFPSFSFGSDIMSSAMSVSGLPTYIEDEQSDDGKSTNNGLNSLKALGSMRDSILSFGGSQTNLPQTHTPQQSEQTSNPTPDAIEDSSKSAEPVSPVQSLPMDSPSPNPPARDSSPDSIHRLSPSRGQSPNLFGSNVNLLPDNMDTKTLSQPANEDDASNDAPQGEQSSLPASHNSSWISHHSRASHLASGLKKQKAAVPPVVAPAIPLVPPSSLPLSTPTTSSMESPVNPTGPAGFYTLPWLNQVTPVTSRMTTPTSNTDSTSPVQPDKSIPVPSYLPNQRSSSPSYVPNQHVSSASYVPPQRSSSPTYIPEPHRSSSPSYMPRVTTQSSLSSSSPLTVDTSVVHPIFSTSSQINTPPNRTVITMSQMGSTVTTTHSTAKLKSRASVKKFSPSTIHRTLTSGITEDSPEKTEEDTKIESRILIKEQLQREWQHKLPMQVKPGPDIRTKEGVSMSSNPSTPAAGAQSAHAKPPKSKRSRKKKNAVSATGKETGKEEEGRGDLEDIGKRELPKNLVDQFPWLADEEEAKKKAKKEKDQKQSDRSKSFSIQRITQQSSAAKTSALPGGPPFSRKLASIGLPTQTGGPTNTDSQSNVPSANTANLDSQGKFPSTLPGTQDSQSRLPSTHPGTHDSQSRAPPTHPGTQDSQRRAPPTLTGTHDSQSRAPPTHTGIQDSQSRAPPTIPGTQDSQSRVPSTHPGTYESHSTAPSTQPVGQESHRRMPVSQSIGSQESHSFPPGQPFWNPSTSDSYPKTMESLTSTSISKQSSVVDGTQMTSKSRIEYTPKQSPSMPGLNLSKQSPLGASSRQSPSYPSVSSQSPNYTHNINIARQSPSYSPSVSASSQSPNYSPSANTTALHHHNVPQSQSSATLPNFGASTNRREIQSPPAVSIVNDNQSRGRKSTHRKHQHGMTEKPTSNQQSDHTASPINSPADSSNSSLFTEFHLAPSLGINPNLMPSSSTATDNRAPSMGMSHKQDPVSSRMPPISDAPGVAHQQTARSSTAAMPIHPVDNFLFSPTSSSSSSAPNQSSVFANPATNRSSDNNQSEGDDFMTLAQAEKSLDFLSNSPDQSQNVESIDLSSLPLFDTPTSTPSSAPSSMQTSVQSSMQPSMQTSVQSSMQTSAQSSMQTSSHSSIQQQQQPSVQSNTAQSHRQPVSGRASADRHQQPYGQSPSHQTNMRSNQMYPMPNTGPGQVMSPHAPVMSPHAPVMSPHAPVVSPQAPPTSHAPSPNTPAVSQQQGQSRFMPSPDMHPQHPGHHGGNKRPASESSHPTPNPKRTAIMQHHHSQQLALHPHMQQTPHDLHRGGSGAGMVLERPPVQGSHIHRVEHGMHRGQTPPMTQQVGSPHGPQQQQHNQRSIERQTPTYDLNQSVAHQRNRTAEIVQASSRADSSNRGVPTYDLTQSVGPQRNRSVERPTSGTDTSSSQRMSTYDLIQSTGGTQRTRSVERQSSETQRIPTYDLTQRAGPQRTRSVERTPSGPSETQRGPMYNIPQSGGTQGTQRTRSVERTPSGSEAQRGPVYNLSQSAGAHRNPVERQPSRAESQRAPTYDLSQSAVAQRSRSIGRNPSSSSSASQAQKIPTFDLTQSPHRDHHAPPKQRTKRQQNNTDAQYYQSSDTTSSLRHMDSNIAQESNPWSGFPPSQRSGTSTEPTLSSPPFLPNFTSPVSQSLPPSMSQSESVPASSSSSGSIVSSLSPSRRLRNDMPTYHHLPHPHISSLLPSPPQASKSSIGREAEISTPFNPMFQPAHTRAGLAMNVPPNFPPVFHEHAHGHQHAPPPFNVGKGQLPGSVSVHPTFNFNNIFNEMPGPNTSHSDTLPVHAAMHLHGNPAGMSVEDSMAHMRGNVQGRHVHGHPQAFGNNMRIDSLLPNVTADGRTFKVGVPMGAPFHAASFGPGMPY